MSKAFVKDDADVEGVTEVDPADLVPEGAVNYLTSTGLAKFAAELTALNEQAAAAGRADDGADGGVDRRRRYLIRLLEISRPIDPAAQTGDRVRFGATVVVTDEDGTEFTYRIVGIHEADARAGKVSWVSPVGKALLGAAAGDVVLLRRPDGDVDLDVVSVSFEAIT